MANGRTTTKKTTKVPAGEKLAPTSIEEWKKDSPLSLGGHDLPLPSGKVCRVRRPGMDVFLQLGMIPNSLREAISVAASGEVSPDDKKLQAKLEKAAQEAMSNPDKLMEMMRMADDVAVYCVVAPSLTSNRWQRIDVLEGRCDNEDVGDVIPFDKRDDAKLYPEEVDAEDKWFIFEYVVGGTKDLERFRGQKAAGVGAVRPRKAVQKSASRARGARSK